jgi:hypothetical protein
MSHDPRRDFADHEMEALAIFVEEAGEALADLGKMLRHGKIATDTVADLTTYYDNRAALQKEVIDVLVAMLLLEHVGLLSVATPLGAEIAVEKAEKMAKRFHYIGAGEWLDVARKELSW